MMLSNGKVAKMPDKKLTDNEIVKALECRVKGKCPECPYFHSYPCDKCKKLDKDALDLINHLQAENERLKDEVKEHIKKSVAKRKYDKALIKAEAYKECIEKVKELSGNYTGYAFDEKIDNLLKELGAE